MAIGDYYQVVLTTRYKTLAYCNNVFFYKQTAGGADVASSLNSGFVTNVGNAYKAAMSNECTLEKVLVTNLFNVADANEFNYAAGTIGTQVASPEPPFVTAVVKYVRQRSDMRHGWKRFAHVPENDVEDGALTVSAQGRWNTLRLATMDTLNPVSPSPASFVPCIVKRLKYMTPEETWAYRLPINVAEAQSYALTGAVLVTNVSTQNSRKIGRGI